MPPARPSDASPCVLLVHHTVSPALAELVDAAAAGVTHPDLEGAVALITRPALSATAHDTLTADGYLLVAPVNIGWIAGALKHFFDTIYYPCLTETRGRPFGLVVHGNNDTAGGLRSVEPITTGLGWHAVGSPVEVIGAPSAADLDAVRDLGATVAASTLDL